MRAIPLLVVAVLAVTACSSGDDEATTTTAAEETPATIAPVETSAPPATTAPPPTTAAPTTTAPPATTAAPATTEPPATTAAPTTTAVPSITSTTINPPIEPDDPFAADKQLALSALLTVEDFGDGWEVEPPAEGFEDDEIEAQFDACIDPDDPDGGDVLEGRSVESGEFEPIGANFPSVNQEIGLATDEAEAIAAMERVGSERALPCYQQFLGEIVIRAFAEDDSPDAPDVVVGNVTVEEIALGLPRDIAIDYRTNVPLTVDGDDLVLVLDIRFLRQGRALSQLQFEGVNEPVTESGQDTIMNVVLERLAAIGGVTGV